MEASPSLAARLEYRTRPSVVIGDLRSTRRQGQETAPNAGGIRSRAPNAAAIRMKELQSALTLTLSLALTLSLSQWEGGMF